MAKAEKIGGTDFRSKLVAGTQNQVMKPEDRVASQLKGCRRDLQVGMEMICLGERGWAALTEREFINRHYKNWP